MHNRDNPDKNLSLTPNSPRFPRWILAVAVVILLMILWNAQQTVSKIEHYALNSYQSKISHQIHNAIEDKRSIFMALALSLTTNPRVTDIMRHESSSDSVLIRTLIEKFSQQINYPNLWVQVIDQHGYSRFRSWSPAKDDYILGVRKDLKALYQDPRPESTISVGRFTLSMKSIVPIYNKQQAFMGVLEIVAPFDPMVQFLSKGDPLESVLLANKSFRTQLTRANPDNFIDDYYLLNPDIRSENRRFVKQNLTQILDKPLFSPDSQQFWSVYPIKNDSDRLLGYWLTAFDRSQAYTAEVDGLFKQAFYTTLAFLAMLLLLLGFTFFKYQSDKRHHYYRQIFNSASDILLVTDGEKLYEANSHFFEFFDDINNLKQFAERYGSIYTQFVKEPGWLHEGESGEFWLDYVASHPDKHHKAKINRYGDTRYFAVKASRLKGYEHRFTVALQDISIQVEYQNQLMSLANTDTLTGVGNRLSFDRRLIEEVNRAHRYDSEVSLILFDIDFFKSVNDQFGHDAGDEVLQWVVNKVRGYLRDTDCFSRYGGEEFAILLPETSLGPAADKAEIIRQSFESEENPTINKTVTLSFGVCALSIWDNDKTLFKHADNALYKAKQEGRNQVVKSYNQVEQSSRSVKENLDRHT